MLIIIITIRVIITTFSFCSDAAAAGAVLLLPFFFSMTHQIDFKEERREKNVNSSPHITAERLS